ncbi:MAG: hypothetical protein K8R31_04815 [Bacteroidales bacterium]|nr:hypothetical protein [Bacteroidales bacterium]
MRETLNKINKIIRCNIPGNFESEPVRKTVTINLFLIIGITFLVSFGIQSIIKYKISYAIVLLTTAIVSLSVFLYLQKSRNFKIAGLLIVLILFFLETYLIINGGLEGTAFLWHYVFPVLSLFTLGLIWGSIFTFLLLGITTILFFTNPAFMYPYDTVLEYIFIFSFLSVYLIAITFEFVRDRTYKSLLLSNKKQSLYLEKITQQQKEILSQNTELEKHRYHLEQLVKERTLDLEIAKEKAEESDRLKSSFLANMSHEIRTPLNAMVGFSTLITDPDLPAKQKNEISYYINHNSDTLLRLIDDIIDLSKIESGQLKVDKRECNIDKIFSLLFEIFNEKRENLSKNKIEIKINNKLKKKNFIIYTDPTRLQQILSNLIDNALKFTEKGFVEYGCFFSDKNNQELTFYVKDTGIGLYPDQQDQIFNRFNKIEEDKRKLYRGTGLGLSISKNLGKLLGGKLWVESEKNKGSTFYFTIPF